MGAKVVGLSTGGNEEATGDNVVGLLVTGAAVTIARVGEETGCKEEATGDKVVGLTIRGEEDSEN